MTEEVKDMPETKKELMDAEELDSVSGGTKIKKKKKKDLAAAARSLNDADDEEPKKIPIPNMKKG